MTNWWNGRAVLFDLESDSPDPEEARIITACVAAVKPGRTPDVRSWMAKPEREIPAGAIEVHGITTEHATGHGGARENVIAEIAYGLAQLASLDVPVVGHNVGSYDFTLLDREMRRLGIGSLAGGTDGVRVRIDGRETGRFYVIDTMIIDKAIDTYRPGPKDPVTGEKLGGRNQLGPTAETYGVPMDPESAHAADADALAAGRVAWAMARRASMSSVELAALYTDRRRPADLILNFQMLSLRSLSSLHAAQVRWAEEQANGFREYCAGNPEYAREKGINLRDINGEWPLRTLRQAAATDITTELV